jgi:hypothetical protein
MDITGLTPDTDYCYTVWAYESGTSSYSEGYVTVCGKTNKLTASCSELKALGQDTSGIYYIDPNNSGTAVKVYCDMVTDGGGWTLVLAQYEDDPVTNWNEGKQSDYDPSLATKKGFALNTSQIPTHSQVSFGKDLNPTFVDYVDFTYSTGNIPVTTLISPKTRKGYQVYRNTSDTYNQGDPEGTYLGNQLGWNNNLSIDELGGTKYSWTFCPLIDSVPGRTYAMSGDKQITNESYAWTVWVRSGAVDTVKASCKDWYDSGNTTDGYYAINPNGTTFTTYCDMTNGGWTLIGNILGTNIIYPVDYTNGKGNNDYLPLTEWIRKSADFNTYSNPALKVAMGSVVDYFIPNGVSFSTMMTTSPSNKFKWTNDLSKPFITPSYYSLHLGGSARYWPVNNISGDSRQYLSFWSSNSTMTGGCCHSTYSDAVAWGRPFKIWVKEEVTELSYDNATCKTIKNTTGTDLSGVYTINPSGTPFQVYCDMITDGGGWTLVWKNFGGVDNLSSASRMSTQDLWNSTGVVGMVQPIIEKVESAKNKDAWNYFINQPNKEWLSYDLLFYNSNNTINGPPQIKKFIFNGNRFIDIKNANTSTMCSSLSYPIDVYASFSGEPLAYSGKTNYILHATSVHIGLASYHPTIPADACGQSSSNYISYAARHDFSYSYNVNDINRVRCVRRCWDGTENYYEAIQWLVR